MSPSRKIGSDSINPIGFGAMGLNSFYAPLSRGTQDSNVSLLHKVIDAQCMIDTADIYGDAKMGENEELIANALGQGKKVFIATKFGNYRDEAGNWTVRGSPDYVKEACAKSLKALGVDQIDLYYQHRVDRTVPIEETVKAMKKLQDEGKIRYIGLSEATEEEIRRASKEAKIDALQIEFSPWTPDVLKNGISDCCKELGITLVAYSPLGRGFLTGAITKIEDLDDGDFRKNNPRFAGEAFANNFKLVEQIKAIADKKGCTPGQISLAWVLAQGDHIIPIPGTKREKYLDENLAAADIVLSEEERKEIDDIVFKFQITGSRYEEARMGGVAF